MRWWCVIFAAVALTALWPAQADAGFGAVFGRGQVVVQTRTFAQPPFFGGGGVGFQRTVFRQPVVFRQRTVFYGRQAPPQQLVPYNYSGYSNAPLFAPTPFYGPLFGGAVGGCGCGGY